MHMTNQVAQTCQILETSNDQAQRCLTSALAVCFQTNDGFWCNRLTNTNFLPSQKALQGAGKMMSSRVPSQPHASRSDAEAGEQRRHQVPLQAGRAAWLTMKAGSMLELDLACRRVSRSPAHKDLVAGRNPTHQPASPGSRYRHVIMIWHDDDVDPTDSIQ